MGGMFYNASSFTNFYLRSGVKYAVAPYDNYVVSASGWGYFTSDAKNSITNAGDFEVGKGYSMKIAKAGVLDFIETLNTTPEIILNEGKNSFSSKNRYINNKTKGLDPGSNVGAFTGANANFKVLTNQDYESTVVPIGLKAEAGKIVVFLLKFQTYQTVLKCI